MSVVHVVILPISDVESLPPPQRARRQSELARVALRRCAELAGAPLEGWTKDANDVPQPQHGWHWSIAHKPTMAVAAIARVPVGVDVERIVPRRNEGLFDHVADEDEWRIMGGRSWHSFYRLWTAKEAVLKANGVGIGSLGKCRVVAATDTAVEVAFDGWPRGVHQREIEGHMIGVTFQLGEIAWHDINTDSGLFRVWNEQAEAVNKAKGLGVPRRHGGWVTLLRRPFWVRRQFMVLKDCPEFEYLDQVGDMRDAHAYVFPWWEGARVALIVAPVMGIASWISRQSKVDVVPEFIVIVSIAWLASIITGARDKARAQRRLRKYLSDHGVAICLECGYDLRGQVEPRCPECGWRVQRAGVTGAKDR